MTKQNRLLALAEGLVAAHGTPLPESIRREAIRSLRNVGATAIGGLDIDGTRTVCRHFKALSAGPIQVFGSTDRFSAHDAALLTGLSAHMDDFDDTHLRSSVHASAAAFAASITAAQMDGSQPAGFLSAFALGCEIQFRVGYGMMPWHYDRGWHITGTVGSLGATTAAGLMMGLDGPQLARALSLACAQSLGLREAFGTSAKPFHPGKAAANGLLAVLLTRDGLVGAEDALFGPNGFYQALSDQHEPDRVTEAIGTKWYLSENTYKPYPCGLVIHPLIDLGIALHDQGLRPSDVDEARIHAHPIVRELTGNPMPVTPLEARFSGIHGFALGLAFGQAGTAEFDTHGLANAEVAQLRTRTTLVDDESVGWTGCAGTFRLSDARTMTHTVPVARGSLERPLTDDELHAKFNEQVTHRLGERSELLWDQLGAMKGATAVSELLLAATPA